MRRLVVALLVLVTLMTAVGAAWRAFSARLQPVTPGADQGRAVTVEIPKGASSLQIARLLAERGVIRDPRVFVLYLRWQRLADRLRAGEYRLSPAMSVPEIVDKLVRGEVVTYPLTIPEGYTVEQVIDTAVRSGLFAGDELRYALESAAASWPYLPDGMPLHQPLEGYLFPDTYLLTRQTDASTFVSMMLRRFEDVFSPAWRRRAEELGLSIHQVVTLASIIERETPLEEERPLVSAVYHNRLRRGMRLQADPTVLYALGRTDGRILYEDLAIDSPYNTYRYPGLPPGPIANPGASSLEAALYPADVDYLYFVSKFDGTGAHAFARTLDEHQRNVRTYRPR